MFSLYRNCWISWISTLFDRTGEDIIITFLDKLEMYLSKWVPCTKTIESGEFQIYLMEQNMISSLHFLRRWQCISLNGSLVQKLLNQMNFRFIWWNRIWYHLYISWEGGNVSLRVFFVFGHIKSSCFPVDEVVLSAHFAGVEFICRCHQTRKKLLREA